MVSCHPSLPPYYSDVLRRDSLNPDALYTKALCYYYQDMQDKANTFFQRALRADPDHYKSRVAIKVCMYAHQLVCIYIISLHTHIIMLSHTEI